MFLFSSETQRHRLLRIVAGLVVLVGFLAVGPVSRRFSDWTLGFVGSVLSRAEAAARYLLITEACLIISRNGLDLDRRRIPEFLAPVVIVDDDGMDISLTNCQGRLRALRAVLMDLPRYAGRLLRRMEKQVRRTTSGDQASPRPEQNQSALLGRWRLAAKRVERPPDKVRCGSAACFPYPRHPGGRRRRLRRCLGLVPLILGQRCRFECA